MNENNDLDKRTDENIDKLIPTPPEKKSIKIYKYILGVLVIVLLIIGTAVAGYFYGQDSRNNNQENVSKTSGDTATKSVANQAIHYISNTGYPMDETVQTKKFTIKLGVPGMYQVVRISSNVQNRGSEQAFTTMFNNEMGRWYFDNPDNPDRGQISELSLLAITPTWLSENGEKDFKWSVYGYQDTPLETPSQKQTFINDLKSSTNECANDSGKGFTTKDGNMNVCFTYGYGQGAPDYYPIVIINGYGEISGQPMVLEGVFYIFDNTVPENLDAQYKAQAEARAGKPTKMTVDAQKDIINALKQTTISVDAD